MNIKKHIALVLSISILSLPASKADLLLATKALITLGLTDTPTVHHNISVYISILSHIEKNISNKKIVYNSIIDLSNRLKVQSVVLGSDLSHLMMPEIENSFLEALMALKKNDLSLLKSKIQIVKLQLKNINQSI